MSAPDKRTCPHCGLLLSKCQVNQHLEWCQRLLLASAHSNSRSSGSGSDFEVNGMINDVVPGTFDVLNGTISTTDFQDHPLPDIQNMSWASPNPIASAALIPEWFELYLSDNADNETDEEFQHHESNMMLDPVTLDITNSTNEVTKLLTNLHDLELDEEAWTLYSMCKWVQLYKKFIRIVFSRESTTLRCRLG